MCKSGQQKNKWTQIDPIKYLLDSVNSKHVIRDARIFVVFWTHEFNLILLFGVAIIWWWRRTLNGHQSELGDAPLCSSAENRFQLKLKRDDRKHRRPDTWPQQYSNSPNDWQKLFNVTIFAHWQMGDCTLATRQSRHNETAVHCRSCFFTLMYDFARSLHFSLSKKNFVHLRTNDLPIIELIKSNRTHVRYWLLWCASILFQLEAVDGATKNYERSAPIRWSAIFVWLG